MTTGGEERGGEEEKKGVRYAKRKLRCTIYCCAYEAATVWTREMETPCERAHSITYIVDRILKAEIKCISLSIVKLIRIPLCGQ